MLTPPFDYAQRDPRKGHVKPPSSTCSELVELSLLQVAELSSGQLNHEGKQFSNHSK